MTVKGLNYSFIISVINQIDKTQPYSDNKRLISVFEKRSIYIVSAISLAS